MSIPEAQAKVLNDLAASGNADAGKWADEAGITPKPATTEGEKSAASGGTETVEAKASVEGEEANASETQPRTEDKTKTGVDDHRDEVDKGGRPDKNYAERRRLKRERREALEQRDAATKRAAELVARIEALEASAKSPRDGSKPESTEEDVLATILTKPEDYLTAREKKFEERIVKQLAEAMTEHGNRQAQIAQHKADSSSAIKMLQTIKGFNSESDEDNEKMLDLMEEEFRLDEGALEQQLRANPIRTAGWMKKTWERVNSTDVSSSVKSDKASAKSSASGGGQTHTKTSLGDLNSRAKGAKSSEDLDKIWGELEKASA